jgi:hypothetical protein
VLFTTEQDSPRSEYGFVKLFQVLYGLAPISRSSEPSPVWRTCKRDRSFTSLCSLVTFVLVKYLLTKVAFVIQACLILSIDPGSSRFCGAELCHGRVGNMSDDVKKWHSQGMVYACFRKVGLQAFLFSATSASIVAEEQIYSTIRRPDSDCRSWMARYLSESVFGSLSIHSRYQAAQVGLLFPMRLHGHCACALQLKWPHLTHIRFV